MKLLSTFVLVTAVTLVGGCKKKDEGAISSSGGGEKTGAMGRAGVIPDYSAWDIAGKTAAWQGSWVVKENGTVQAWTVTGDKVQTWDGKEEKQFTLKVTEPCRAAFANDKNMEFPRTFSVVDGALAYRGDGGGYRKGTEAIFCDMSGENFILDAAGKCVMWESDFGKFKKVDAVCGFRKNADGEEVFFHEGKNQGEFAIKGDAIIPKSSFESFKVDGDFAAAKAARDAKVATP